MQHQNGPVALNSAQLLALTQGDDESLPMTVGADVDEELDGLDADPEEVDEDGIPQPETIEVWKAACFNCDSFNPGKKLKYHGADLECHHSNGNPSCPGGRYQVVVLGPKVKALQALRACADQHGRTSLIYVQQFGAVLAGLPNDEDREFVMNSL